jgi:hypothetical protein
VAPEYTSIVRQRLGKQVSAATDRQATIEELLGMVFSVRSVRSCNKRSDWGYNGATVFLGDKSPGTWPSRLGKSRI